MFNLNLAKSKFVYELNISTILAKLHLAAAKFTKETAKEKICITANSGIKNDEIKNPDPENTGTKIEFDIDSGPDFTLTIVAICDDLTNEYSLLNKPEYSAVASSVSTYENNRDPNKTLLDDMILCIQNNKNYVVVNDYKQNADVFNKCFAEVKKIKTENDKKAKDYIAKTLFSAYFENFIGKESATQASNPNNLVYLDDVDITDVVQDFEQQFTESGLKAYSDKLKKEHEANVKKLNELKAKNNQNTQNDNQQNKQQLPTSSSTSQQKPANNSSNESMEFDLMRLLFEDAPKTTLTTPGNLQQTNNNNQTTANTATQNNQNNNQNNKNTNQSTNLNTNQNKQDNQNDNQDNQNNDQDKLQIVGSFPEKVEKIYAFAVGYSIETLE